MIVQEYQTMSQIQLLLQILIPLLALLLFVRKPFLACLNQHIFAENQSTIVALENCQSSPWVPDLYYVSVDGELPFADLVIDEGGRRCSSNGECLKYRPLQYQSIDLTVTVKEYVENQVRIADDIAHDIENEANAILNPSPGAALEPGMFLWRVNLTTTLRPDESTGGTSDKWYNEIRDVAFAKYLIACD
jgi:hypothetical protein